MQTMLTRLLGEDVRLACALAPHPCPVTADPFQLERVLVNLAVNARDAMPSGGQLTVETTLVELDEAAAAVRPKARPGCYVRLAVTDTGCGMSAETQSHLFEPFFTTKEDGRGTGLGLATVYGIVQQSAGSLSVYSESGRGSTFKIYLPLAAFDGPPAAPEPAAAAYPPGTEAVLLVEDQEDVLALTREALELAGYTVLEASSGPEALRLVAEAGGPPDLLVTDVVLPGMSGRELAEHLLAAHPGLKVLYMSGYTEDAVTRHGILGPSVQFIQKPFTPLALVRKAREVLDQK
jgi:CheY-like chemotaxis protein